MKIIKYPDGNVKFIPDKGDSLTARMQRNYMNRLIWLVKWIWDDTEVIEK
jgi:hypothetical protein